MKPKRELARVVRSPEGAVTLDLKGKSPGRGAYVCRDAACLKRAVKSKSLSRALGAGIPEEIYAGIAGQLEESDG
jgi:predicted RNA-binding protein YlxR (DUF448 family)